MSFSTWNFNSISVNEACRVARFKQEHDWYSLKFRDWTENGSTRFRVRSEETGTERNGTKRNGGRGRVGPGRCRARPGRCRARPGPGADRCPSNGCKPVGGSAAFSEELAELRPFRPIGSWWNIRVFRPRQPSGRRQHRHRPFHSIPHTHTDVVQSSFHPSSDAHLLSQPPPLPLPSSVEVSMDQAAFIRYFTEFSPCFRPFYRDLHWEGRFDSTGLYWISSSIKNKKQLVRCVEWETKRNVLPQWWRPIMRPFLMAEDNFTLLARRAEFLPERSNRGDRCGIIETRRSFSFRSRGDLFQRIGRVSRW